MTSIMRRTVRGVATGLGALAIVAGASACGGLLGGGEEDQGDTKVEEKEPAEGEEGAAAGESEGDAASSDGGEDAPASDGGDSEDAEGAEGALSEDDLTAGSERFTEFLHALDDDGVEACSFILDPTTGAGMSGEAAEACGPAISSGFEQQGTELQPGMFDVIDVSMIELSDNGDGTAAVSLSGTDMGMNMVQADDGQWYIEAPEGTF